MMFWVFVFLTIVFSVGWIVSSFRWDAESAFICGLLAFAFACISIGMAFGAAA